MTAEFEKAVIKTRTPGNDAWIEREGYILPGSGLGYHPFASTSEATDEETGETIIQQETHYIITHISSGYRLPNFELVEDYTRVIIRCIAPLVDWSKDNKEIYKEINFYRIPHAIKLISSSLILLDEDPEEVEQELRTYIPELTDEHIALIKKDWPIKEDKTVMTEDEPIVKDAQYYLSLEIAANLLSLKERDLTEFAANLLALCNVAEILEPALLSNPLWYSPKQAHEKRAGELGVIAWIDEQGEKHVARIEEAELTEEDFNS